MIIHRPVAGDHGEPGTERVDVPQRVKPPQRQNEHVLHQVVDLAARHPRQQDSVYHAGKELVEPSERGPVPLLRGADQGGVLAMSTGELRDHRLTLPQPGPDVNRSLHPEGLAAHSLGR